MKPPGAYISAVSFKYEGFLVRNDLVTGDSESCSGTLVSPTVFLTAAHCVCEKDAKDKNAGDPYDTYYENFADCSQKQHEPHSTRVFFPAYGDFSILGAPIVNQKYRFLNITTTALAEGAYAPGDIADLAIVHLQYPVASTVPQLVQKAPEDIEFFVGYGLTRIYGDIKKAHNVPIGSYDNFPVAEFSPRLKSIDPQLPDLAEQDFNPTDHTGDPEAAICSGDSGGGMFSLRADHIVSLVAVASGNIHRPAVYPGCPEISQAPRTMFTSILEHVGWINSEIMKDTAGGKPWEPKCGDARFDVYRGTSTHISLVADKDDLRATLFIRDNIETNPNLADLGCSPVYKRRAIIGCEIKKSNQDRI